MNKKWSLGLLTVILVLAAYLRLWGIADYMTFLGDEGRDVLVAKGILEGHFTLLGPRASAGDFFLGPIYYYMIAPWLWLFHMDPVGPAVMVALFGIATVWLIYYVGKKWFNEVTGLTAAALYAVSPVVINYSHSSWNPDVLPFFSLLLMFLLFKTAQVKPPTKYFIGVGLLLGIVLQLHYLSLFLIIIAFVYIFFSQWYIIKKLQFIIIVRHYLEVLLGFVIGFSPFLAFEFRHGFPNIQAILSFIFSDTLQKSYVTNTTFWGIVSDVFFRVFARLVFYFPAPDKYYLFNSTQLTFFAWFVVIIAIAVIISLFFIKNKLVILITSLWFFIGVISFGFYKKPIYDYYFTFMFPLPFLIVGNFFSQLSTWGKDKKQKIILIILANVLFSGIFLYDFGGRPQQYIPNRQKNQAKIISEAVIQHAGNKPYNFALISKGNSDHAYRYFLDVLGHPPSTIQNTILDPKRESVTDQLLIVCEDVTCQPLGYSLFDIAGFGRAEIVGSWDVSVVKVYRLVHFVEGKGK
ncbi:glycosyltransferase family 39 protein [Candidatus Roizmanbacteria bacterium]|nr:glycosyltransferase family 39 protein [Candidatus Roizmanbacteria bacterium]